MRSHDQGVRQTVWVRLDDAAVWLIVTLKLLMQIKDLQKKEEKVCFLPQGQDEGHLESTPETSHII